ncbi:MAG: hypothetical protein N2376_08175, partial [Clostridia bacterium]|nr:hypothetical protein [Clostridia bacterium]
MSQASSGNVPRFELREKEKILQVTLPGNDSRFTNGILSGNAVIYGALINYNDKLNQTIIRISYPNKITYTHEIVSGSSVIKIKSGNTNIPTASESSAPSPTPIPATQTNTGGSQANTNSSQTNANGSQTDAAGSVRAVFHSDNVQITAPSMAGYKVYRVGNPSRIVLEVPGTIAAADRLMPAGSLYTRAVASQGSSGWAKIELYTQSFPDWSVSEASSQLTLNLSKTDITNIQGGGND